MMDIIVNELTRREKKAQAFSDLSCSAAKVGEKRQRDEFAAEICNTEEQNSRRGSNDNGCAERGEESVQCADPKFNDFDKLREESNFAVGQTWALYDDAKVDGMPRLYAQIRRVSATPSFGVRITYLEPDPDDEKEIKWFEEDLPVSTGKFRLGKNENTKDISKFSHLIQCKEGSSTGSNFTISPRKGETWALFKNWDINWSSEPDSHRSYDEYEFVEILSDYADGTGVFVSYLHKAKGFASVFFKTGTDPADIFRIYNLYRFSHMVPSFKLSGTEAKGVPKDAYELDQAALPKTIHEVTVPSYSESQSKPKRQDIYFATKEKVFQTGQVWSFRSGYDELPLYYGKIQKISFTHAFNQKPTFKLHIGRLKATTPFPMDVTEWEHKRMPVGCGTFYARKALETITTSQVSQQVTPQISMDGTEYTILPKIGEVWVIYRHWCYDLDIEDPEEFGFNEYDVVEILDDALDYKVLLLELQSVSGEEYSLFEDEKEDEYRLLRAVKGRKYHGEDDDDESEPVFTIPKSKRLRFSNKVAASRVTREIHGELKDLFKVDAGALPPCIKYPDY